MHDIDNEMKVERALDKVGNTYFNVCSMNMGYYYDDEREKKREKSFILILGKKSPLMAFHDGLI